MASFVTLPVSEIRQLTPDAVEVCFKIPADQRAAFAFRAGQYITLKHTIKGAEVRRAYSISSAPHGDTLCVGIKKVSGGVFSTFANETLRAGDTLEVMPPQGRFVFEPEGGARNLVAIAAGSGVTPIMSIMRTALEETSDARVVLLLGNRNPGEAMYLQDIQDLSNKYNDRFFAYHAYSRAQEDGALFGRIDRSLLNFVLKNKHKGEVFDRYYLCGPEELIREAEGTLTESGVAPEAILHELFTTPDAGEEAAKVIAEGQAQVEIILDDQTYTLAMDQKDVILDAALKAKIDAPYSCQGGVCSTCIARITEGSAHMAKNQILTDSEIAEGLVLTCQAHPTSPTLRVDYDDV